MPVDGISTYGSQLNQNGTSATRTSSTELSMDDFYKLLAAQLKYQDSDNPMDSSEMMAQMVQTQMSSAIQDMSAATDQLAMVNLTSYASSMVGKEVTVAEVDENGVYTKEDTTGVVTGVLLGTNPLIYIGDKSYTLSQLMSIGEVPDQKPTPTPHSAA